MTHKTWRGLSQEKKTKKNPSDTHFSSRLRLGLTLVNNLLEMKRNTDAELCVDHLSHL